MSVVGVKRESRDQSTFRHTVFGYIRRYEVDGYVYVPKVIKSICLDFYWLEEKFAENDTTLLSFEEDGRLVHNLDSLPIETPLFWVFGGFEAFGSIWIGADSQGISKGKWTLQITNRCLNILSIGLTDGHNILHDIVIHKDYVRGRKTGRSGRFVKSAKLRHEFDSFEEVIMELDLEDHTLNFNIRASSPRRVRIEMRDIPKANYHLTVSLGRGHCLRLQDFSIEHRPCSEIPVISRDVHFPCTYWIIRILLVVLWVIIDYKLNRYCHQTDYLLPKIIFSAVLEFVLGIRYGVHRPNAFILRGEENDFYCRL